MGSYIELSEKSRTPWSTKLEPEGKPGDSSVLLEQQYGTEREWKQHFEYLLPFFRDPRYIKVDGKPAFMVYKTSVIYCLGEMTVYWRSLAQKAGFPDIYLIDANN